MQFHVTDETCAYLHFYWQGNGAILFKPYSQEIVESNLDMHVRSMKAHERRLEFMRQSEATRAAFRADVAEARRKPWHQRPSLKDWRQKGEWTSTVITQVRLELTLPREPSSTYVIHCHCSS